MRDRYSELAERLSPYLLKTLARVGQSGGSGGGGSAPGQQHALDGDQHIGTLGNEQAPQFLLRDGSRSITGNIAMEAGVKIDGLDPDVHMNNPSAHHDPVSVVAPLGLSGQQVSLSLATNPGLENVGGLRAKISNGIGRDASGLFLRRKASDSGLEFDAGGAAYVYVADLIDPAGGLRESGNNLLIKLVAGASGLDVGASGLAVDPGHGLLINANDEVAVNQAASFTWSGTHQFNVDPQVNANLDFIGGHRRITSGADLDLTLAPDRDLYLDPGGTIYLPDDQELRTPTYTDLPSGIAGMRLWTTAGDYRRLTIGAIKADELHVRAFVADAVRANLSEEIWSKGRAIVETDFTVPATGSQVNVWFEDIPELGDARIFSVNERVLLRFIDWSTGIVAKKVWFRVTAVLSDDRTNKRQQYRLIVLSADVQGLVIKKGSVAVNYGLPGEGWIHLSALKENGGPFLQMGDWVSNPLSPSNFRTYVRMGNLSGTVDYTGDTYGFATGSNLSNTPANGFSGITSDPVKGARLFNTDINIYKSGDLHLSIARNTGVSLKYLTSLDPYSPNEITGIFWRDDPSSPSSRIASMYFYGHTQTPGVSYGSIIHGSSTGPYSTNRDFKILLPGTGHIGISDRFNEKKIELMIEDGIRFTMDNNLNRITLRNPNYPLTFFGVNTATPLAHFHVGGFARIDGTLDVRDATTVQGAVTSQTQGSGSVALRPGNNSLTGYIEWRKPNDVRLGYIGWHDTNVRMQLENGAKFVVAGSQEISGSLAVNNGATISTSSHQLLALERTGAITPGTLYLGRGQNLFASGLNGSFLQSPDNLVLGMGGSSQFSLMAGQMERMRVDASGNMRVGGNIYPVSTDHVFTHKVTDATVFSDFGALTIVNNGQRHGLVMVQGRLAENGHNWCDLVFYEAYGQVIVIASHSQNRGANCTRNYSMNANNLQLAVSSPTDGVWSVRTYTLAHMRDMD